MKWWNDRLSGVKELALSGAKGVTGTPARWWMVVIKEPVMGGVITVSDVAQCKPFTGEHRTKIEHKHDDADGGSVYILFEQAATASAASEAALAEMRVYQKLPVYTEIWQDIQAKWSVKDQEAKERRRRSAYATIGDLEDAIATHEVKCIQSKGDVTFTVNTPPTSTPEVPVASYADTLDAS